MHIECSVNVAYVLKKITKDNSLTSTSLQVEQLGQNGHNVAVMAHKPNQERDANLHMHNPQFKYSIDGPTWRRSRCCAARMIY